MAKKRKGSKRVRTEQPATRDVPFQALQRALAWVINDGIFSQLPLHGNTTWTADQLVVQAVLWVWSDKDTLTGLLSRLHEAHTGLRAAIQASGATEASVRSASARVAAVEAELAVERLRLYGQISPILTSAQVEKMKEMQARRDDFVDIVIGRISDWLAE